MWPFSRRRPRPAKRSAAPVGFEGLHLPVRVVGALRPGYLRVIVGEGREHECDRLVERARLLCGVPHGLHHGRTMSTGNRRSLIGAIVCHHDNLVGSAGLRGQRVQSGGNIILLVVGRNKDQQTT